MEAEAKLCKAQPNREQVVRREVGAGAVLDVAEHGVERAKEVERFTQHSLIELLPIIHTSSGRQEGVVAATGATIRLAVLFEKNQGVPIDRSKVQAIANQLDYMKRLRRNGGARDILDSKGIALLWGKGDRAAIAALGLGSVSDTEFISYQPKTQAELNILRKNGHAELVSPF